ncbi:hypothetical protein RD792_012606 [Penstemon davidsonii]|uniref:HSF-type DNA-binding domain-containing protein n=1 Tax=Penstemon davidsonii TaxID=160366 RepID=A0ABR0CXB8_9LAMI|nr:hypothetical protein RD792_012606 [Penstemon davidsonii]
MMNDSCDQIRIDDENMMMMKSSCNLVRKVPPFLLKTYMLVEDPGTDEVISWNGEGTAFVVWQPADFSRDLLPTLFKHSNFSSFVRQLNTYGFRKVATNRWEFSNDMFRKGQRDKLCQIRRRRKAKAKACSNNNTPPTKDRTISIDHSSDDDEDDEDDINIELDQICCRSSSSSSDHELLLLIHDNKKLKQENQVLSSQLALMKKKCKQLVDLVAINHGSPPNSNSHIIIEEEDQEQEEEECVDDQYQLLEEKINIINSSTTSSSDIHDQGPKLFGVRLINTSSSHQEKGITYSTKFN